MSRKFRRLFANGSGNASKVVPYLRAGYELNTLLSKGMNVPEGEQVKLDDTTYIVKNGSLQKIGNDYRSHEKVMRPDPKFYDREFVHISKDQRKGKTLEDFRALRPETNYSIAKREKAERIAKEKLEAEIRAKAQKNEAIESGSLADLKVDTPDPKKIMEDAIDKTVSKDTQDSEVIVSNVD